MAIESRAFKAIPEGGAHFQPFIAPAPVCKSGAWIGTNMRTRGVEYFDPWWLKVMGIISGAVFLITGDREGGKSTLIKALILRLMRLQAEMLGDESQLIRVHVHSRKPEEGESEFAPVLRFLHSFIHYLNQQGSFNIYDPAMGMTEFDYVDVTVNICEEVKPGPVDEHEALAIMVAIRTMLTSSRFRPSPEAFEQIARLQSLSDLDNYFLASSTNIVQDAREALDTRKETLPVEMGKPWTGRPEALHHITREDFEAASGRVAIYMGRLLRGDYGGVIGGDKSLADVLSAPMLNLDWTGVNAKARTIMQSMMHRWQMSAHAAGRPELIPHLVFQDEIADAMSDLMFVRSWAAKVMKARAFHTAEFTAAQYRNQIANAGEAGSEVRALARNIMLGVGAEFMFRQPPDEEIFRDMKMRGISDQDAYLTTKFGTGEFGLKYPDRPLQIIQHHIGPTIRRLVPTNESTEKMVRDRHSVYEFGAVQERMARLARRGLDGETVTEEMVENA